MYVLLEFWQNMNNEPTIVVYDQIYVTYSCSVVLLNASSENFTSSGSLSVYREVQVPIYLRVSST